MKLNIYENKQVIKTYETDTYDLMFGTLEDVAGAVNLDKLQTGSNAEIIKTAGDFVIHSMDTVKDLMKLKFMVEEMKAIERRIFRWLIAT